MSKRIKKFSKLDLIGSAAAEQDNLLDECFVENGKYIKKITDFNEPFCIILGRTGSGKSALINRIYTKEERTIYINPENLSISYISNSTIINYFLELGIRFDLFFKLLWRHVIAGEILKRHFQLLDEEKTQKWLFSYFSNKPSKKAREAIDYLKKWGSEFWEETDHRVKEITSKYENELSAQVGINEASIRAGRKIANEEKAEVISKAQHFVSTIQISELSNIIDLIDDILEDDQKQYFILIDQLDENWVDEKLRYLLIRSLIETIKDFKKVKNLKIIISIREDLLNRVYQKTRDTGFQKEKYDSLCVKLTWSKENLIKLVNKRIVKVYGDSRNLSEFHISDYLPKQIDKNENPEQYIVDRTLYRPRDIISFFNDIIMEADGTSRITSQNIKDAEFKYSESRLDALSYEWFTDFPFFLQAVELLRGKRSTFSIFEISRDKCDEFCLSLLIENVKADYKIGKIYKIAKEYCEQKIDYDTFIFEYLRIMYEIGMIGLKLHKSAKVIYAFEYDRNIRKAEFSKETRILIHKAFWRALDIKP